MLFKSLFSGTGRAPVTDNDGIQFVKQISVPITAGGTSVVVAASTTSAATAAAVGSTTALVSIPSDCFVRKGTTPTALSDGTDQHLPGPNLYRVHGLALTDKLAFKLASGTGNVYITPGA